MRTLVLFAASLYMDIGITATVIPHTMRGMSPLANTVFVRSGSQELTLLIKIFLIRSAAIAGNRLKRTRSDGSSV